MIWNTKLINEILENFEEDKSIKPILRDITIEHILSDNDEPIIFPFLIDSLTNTLSLRAPKIQFELTDNEKENIVSVHHNAALLVNYIKIANYGKLNSTEKIFSKWSPYPFQIEWMEDYQKYRYNIIKTSRQIGSSNLGMACALHYVLSHHNKSVRFIGRTNQSCENSAIKFYQLYESLPFYMKIGVTELKPKIFTANRKTLMKFENGCEIRFSQADNISGHIDFLIIEDMKDSSVFTNLIPILSSAAGFLIYGLPNNDPIFQQIQLTSSIINHKQYNWNSVPNRDVEWVKQEILNIGGVREFINEYSNGEMTPELKILLRDKLIDDLDLDN